jgi:hypothetical protein
MLDSVSVARFWSKVDKRGPDECWPWLGATTKGYGQFKLGGRTLRAHRVAVTLSGTPIPPKLVIDHECRNRRCCNPEHLRAVTNRKNVLENSVGHAALNLAKTHCPAGHPYDEENTRIVGSRRHCRMCSRDFDRKRRPRK